MPRSGSQHTTMSDKERIALCEHKKKYPSLTQNELKKWLETEHNIIVSQSAISNTLKRAQELLQKSNNVNLSVKRQRTVKYPLMESALVEWFLANQESVNMSGDLLKESASKLLDRLYPVHDPFEFSNGWLESFKLRHEIRSFRRFGESGSVDANFLEKERPKIKEVLDKFEWCDIYNMDETGLFYRMQADNSLATKQLEGRKVNKERLTIAVCCNGDGSDKLPLWIIGKSKSPRCFKNIKIDNLGCKYRSNVKAWMTQLIFLEWLKEFDNRMADRNVLLILDNCSAHIPLDDLSNRIRLRNTTVFYLPPNTTSKLQPCDAGIIRNLKAYYRRRFNRLLLQHFEDNIGEPEKISILDAIRMVVPGWINDVRPETIANCFLHCNIRTVAGAQEGVNEDDLLDKAVVADLEQQITRLRYRNPMDVSNLLNYPDENIVVQAPTLDDIIDDQLVQDDDQATTDEDDSEELPFVSSKDVQHSIQTLELYWLQQEGDNGSFIAALQQMKEAASMIKARQMVQKNIHAYFHCT